MIFVRYPFDYGTKCLDFENDVCANIVKDTIGKQFGYKEFALFCNGRKLQDAEIIPNNFTVHVTFSLPGGKGGFGSMLRAIGAQIEKTTNREACRDLSGRRLRDINEEQRLKKWLAKKAEREAEKIKRRQARIERLKNKPPHNFFNFEYEKEISELPERINDALNEGLKKVKQPVKRPHEKAGPSKSKKTWLSDDFPTSSSDSDVDESNASDNSNSSKKLKLEHKGSSSSYSDISDISQPLPGSSKLVSNFDSEECLSGNSEIKIGNDIKEEEESNSMNINIVKCQDEEKSKNNQTQTCQKVKSKEKEKEPACSMNNVTELSKNTNKISESVSSGNATSTAKQYEDYPPINLHDFQSVLDLEVLGLDRLKSELMLRGLKCGGSLSDRAQRLWKVRSLQPNEYPSNLLAKNKK